MQNYCADFKELGDMFDKCHLIQFLLSDFFSSIMMDGINFLSVGVAMLSLKVKSLLVSPQKYFNVKIPTWPVTH